MHICLLIHKPQLLSPRDSGHLNDSLNHFISIPYHDLPHRKTVRPPQLSERISGIYFVTIIRENKSGSRFWKSFPKQRSYACGMGGQGPKPNIVRTLWGKTSPLQKAGWVVADAHPPAARLKLKFIPTHKSFGESMKTVYEHSRVVDGELLQGRHVGEHQSHTPPTRGPGKL